MRSFCGYIHLELFSKTNFNFQDSPIFLRKEKDIIADVPLSMENVDTDTKQKTEGINHKRDAFYTFYQTNI